MTSSAELRVVFRATAGPQRGFGHLMRCLSLARALDVRPLIALRGGQHARQTALALGADLVAAPTRRTLSRMRPDVVVIDDPIASDADRWVKAARRIGAVVVTVHDLGIGCRESDLRIDGSVTHAARGASRRSLIGPKYAVLDPTLAATARPSTSDRTHRVLIALGGGVHVGRAAAIAEAIVAADPRAEVRIAGGFVSHEPQATSARVRWIGATRGLAGEFQRATVAVVGGGVSLYEACAMGVPAVGVPVVKGQVATVLAFARHRAALAVPLDATPQIAAKKATQLLNNRARRRSLARRARQLVDGRGARRAAIAVTELATGTQL